MIRGAAAFRHEPDGAGIWKRPRTSIIAPAAHTVPFFSQPRMSYASSGEAQRLIKTLQRKGIRFVGTVLEEQSAPV